MLTRYVKGYKIDSQKVADLVEAANRKDPLVDVGICSVVAWLNSSGYVNIATGYKPPTPDGACHLALIITLDVSYNQQQLREKKLGDIDESIMAMLPHVLGGPDVWELCK